MLAIDTSTDVAALALAPIGDGASGDGAEIRWNAGRNQTVMLLGEINHLCRLCDIELDALSAVAVATGPGSFTALRVGMSVAKGLAFALSIPIFGIGTLDATAHGAAHWKLPVRAFVTAGRGRVVAADYVWQNGRLTMRGDMRHRTPSDLAEGLLQPTLLAGELSHADAAALRAQQHVVLPDAAARTRRAATLVDLAAPRWRAGEWDDVVSLEPLYVHSHAASADAARR
ncbi:MAG: tRNA (adenosine(37)-N6)-threonylcarbamoyltransferase complex dimerization subunit type 1 TsaB [Chloroflexi bacterium]|nr:MAG: tRNA (adenosine(37)-N6)-threonylcarbamoyltransferase complex dimerization subunit type 1 TsaB [Chloroflexota bacterium]